MAALLPLQYAKVLYGITQGKSGKELEKAVEIFVQYLAEHNVVNKWQYIAKEYDKIAKEANGIKQITITSAKELSDTMREKIAMQFGDKVEVDSKIDESLIGGIIVKSGNTILDASVRSQLDTLTRTLS